MDYVVDSLPGIGGDLGVSVDCIGRDQVLHLPTSQKVFVAMSREQTDPAQYHAGIWDVLSPVANQK